MHKPPDTESQPCQGAVHASLIVLGLFRVLQPVYKFVSFPGKTAHAVFARQTGNGL